MGLIELLIVVFLMLILIPVSIIVMIFRAFGRRREEFKLTREEEDRFQRMWASLEKMEERITNLETILLERERK
jgi:phage shock protein B